MFCICVILGLPCNCRQVFEWSDATANWCRRLAGDSGQKKLNFPHTLGALDGKHIIVKPFNLFNPQAVFLRLILKLLVFRIQQ